MGIDFILTTEKSFKKKYDRNCDKLSEENLYSLDVAPPITITRLRLNAGCSADVGEMLELRLKGSTLSAWRKNELLGTCSSVPPQLVEAIAREGGVATGMAVRLTVAGLLEVEVQ